MNNGLEELDKLMETFYELCEECNCNEDMHQKYNLTSTHHIIRKKLERLEKLEKVVKILKDKLDLIIIPSLIINGDVKTKYLHYTPKSKVPTIRLNDEDAELLEEVINNVY